MGDRYYLDLPCYECGKKSNVYYAPSSGIETFQCSYCGRYNLVNMTFQATPIPEGWIPEVERDEIEREAEEY